LQTIIGAKKLNTSRGNEDGVSLIETLIALALLGLIAAAFLGGLATAAKATFIADEQATSESLARSEIEYVKNQSYINYVDPEHGSYGLITTPTNYTVVITATPIDPSTGQPLSSGQDQGMQRITVTVKHSGKSVLTVADYKVNR